MDNTAILNQILDVVLDLKAGMKRLEERMDRLEERMDRLEARMDKLESRMDAIESRMDAIEARMDQVESRLDQVEERLDQVEMRLDQVEEHMSHIHKRMSHVENQLGLQQQELLGIRSILEMDMTSNISIIAENHLNLDRKLNLIFQQFETNADFRLRVNYLDMEVRRIKSHLKLA